MNTQPTFEFEGKEYTLAQMIKSNQDDPELIEWLNTAKVGESFCECKRIT